MEVVKDRCICVPVALEVKQQYFGDAEALPTRIWEAQIINWYHNEAAKMQKPVLNFQHFHCPDVSL